MATFEDRIKIEVAPGQSDPPETDLDYYARPENYMGSNLHSLQRIIHVQQKLAKDSGDDDAS